MSTYAVVVAALVLVVPAFRKMFTETGLSLPQPTEAIVGLSNLACSWPGAFLAGVVLPLSVQGFRRWRATRWLVPALYTAIWLSFAFVGLMIYSLFCPLIQVCQKL